MPNKLIARRIITLLLIAILAPTLSIRTHAQQSQGFIPNDPKYSPSWAAQLNLPLAWSEIQRIESTTGPVAQEVVVVILDDGVDCTHPDLASHCLPQYEKNFTGTTSTKRHGSGVASIIAAATNNAIGPASVGGLTDRVKFVSIQVIDANNQTTRDRILQGMQEALDLKLKQGLNIVAINCSLDGAGDNTGVVRSMLNSLKAQGIWVFGAAAGSTTGINLDTNPVAFPAGYAADPGSNVIAVAALDSDGQSVESHSNWGPVTVAFAEPGVNVPVVSFLDKMNGAASFSETSAATPHATAAYAVLRAYKTTDALEAAQRLKMGATMFQNLFGKVGYGRIDLYASLTMPTPPTSLAIWTESNSNRAVALESPMMVSMPFTLYNSHSLGSDTNTRVMLFAVNLDLLAGETASAVTAQTQNGQQLPVESVLPVPNLPWLKQVIIKLPDGLAAPSDLSVSITLHGFKSNQGVISLK